MVFMMLSNFNFKVVVLIWDKITVNVLKFQTLFLSVLKHNVGFRARTHKMFVRMANREDPDQTASSEAV